MDKFNESDPEEQLQSVLGAEIVGFLKDRVVLVEFAELVEQHCDPEELWTALAGITLACDAERWNEEQPATGQNLQQPEIGEPVPIASAPISPTFKGEIGLDRSELKTVIKRLRQCADDLKRLKVRRIHDILKEKYRYPPPAPGGWSPPVKGRPTLGDVLSDLPQLLAYQEDLPWRLKVLALAAEEAAKHVYLRGRPVYDGAVASLVAYVFRQTNDYHDREVSALIGAVSDQALDADVQSKWRRRHGMTSQ